jgi:hypothetical protein
MSKDLVVMEGLAELFIRNELKVPDARSQYKTRNRLAPWESLLPSPTLAELKGGGTPAEVSALDGQRISVGLWPDGTILGLERMTAHVDAVKNGAVRILLLNDSKTIGLVFVLDFKSGRVHTNLDEGGLIQGEHLPDEADVLAYATFFYRVLGNGIAELTCGEIEPIDCEVVIPVNIIPPNPDEAIEAAVRRFREEAQPRG